MLPLSLRRVRVFIVGLVLAAFCAPALAVDPVTLILLRMVRDKVISAGIEAAAQSIAAKPQSPATVAPSPMIDDERLRRLIDEGFVHLTAGQRMEVYASARRILQDPTHAHEAAALYAQLAIAASGVRQAYESINRLSPERKRLIAVEAGAEYEKMSSESRDELVALLRSRVVPLPADLVGLMQAEFERVRAQPTAAMSAK